MNIRLQMGVLCLMLVVEIVTGNIRLQRSPQQYCGSKLADILKILCKTKYNERKRSLRNLENMDHTQLNDYDVLGNPFRSKENTMGFIPSRLMRSPITKITDECCLKPCTITELRSYCAL